MIKTCSLEFLNKETFEADIMTADGRILCSASDKITPEKILRLYFKDIYVEKPLVQMQKTAKEEPIEDALAKEVALVIPEPEIEESQEAEKTEEFEEELTAENIVEVAEVKEEISPQEQEVLEIVKEIRSEPEALSDDYMKFDEEQAQRISDYCARIGKVLKYPKPKLEQLKQAGYYSNIGVTKFKKTAVSNKDFRKEQAQAGYDILLNEMELPDEVANAVKFCVNKYEITAFKLSEEIPYADIIALVMYYDNSITTKGRTKDETLNKMLQLGGNQFNIFVLHKFIKMMRDDNE